MRFRAICDISPKLYRLLARINGSLLAACSAGAFTPSGANPELQQPHQVVKALVVKHWPTGNDNGGYCWRLLLAAQKSHRPSRRRFNRLSQEIGEKLETAVNQADPAIQLQFGERRAQKYRWCFCQKFDDPEIQNSACSIRAPSESAWLRWGGIFNADSGQSLGKANEVAIVDTVKIADVCNCARSGN
jgi:hypothetical protein